MLTWKLPTISSACEAVEPRELAFLASENGNGTTTLQTVWQFLMKLSRHLAYEPAITLLSIYPREMKAYIHTKIYTGVFMALFVIAKS